MIVKYVLYIAYLSEYKTTFAFNLIQYLKKKKKKEINKLKIKLNLILYPNKYDFHHAYLYSLWHKFDTSTRVSLLFVIMKLRRVMKQRAVLAIVLAYDCCAHRRNQRVNILLC